MTLEDRAKALGFDVDDSGNILMLGKVVCTEPVRSVFIYGAECMNKRLSLERFAENLDLEITDENLQMANDILEQKIAARKQKG